MDIGMLWLYILTCLEITQEERVEKLEREMVKSRMGLLVVQE